MKHKETTKKGEKAQEPPGAQTERTFATRTERLALVSMWAGAKKGWKSAKQV